MTYLHLDYLVGNRRSLVERFWEQVDTSGECWIWTGFKYYPNDGKNGPYGMVSKEGHARLAHRIAWEIQKGSIPEGDIRQKCGNTLCMRDTHLEAGSFRGKRRSKRASLLSRPVL